MAQERTEKSPWRSRYGAGWISDAQFLAESMCARRARHDKRDLPLGFWELPKWKRVFLSQLNLANRLLKTYSAGTIIRTLRRKEAQHIYSLGAKFLLPILEEQQELERKQIQTTPPPKPTEPARPKLQTGLRPVFVKKKSAISKIREIDNDTDRAH